MVSIGTGAGTICQVVKRDEPIGTNNNVGENGIVKTKIKGQGDRTAEAVIQIETKVLATRSRKERKRAVRNAVQGIVSCGFQVGYPHGNRAATNPAGKVDGGIIVPGRKTGLRISKEGC